MKNRNRKTAGIDIANVSVTVCGLEAKYWLIYYIIVQTILGISDMIYFIIRVEEKNGRDETSSGILNLFCVVLLLCSFWCLSKTFFTLLTLIMLIDTFAEVYLLFTRILLAVEVDSPFYTDYLILVLFSLIRVFFSWLFTVILMRLSWCNGLPDEHDLEHKAIYECIREMSVNQYQAKELDVESDKMQVCSIEL